MSYAALQRPSSLDDLQWEAVTTICERMDRARSDGDWELVVGSSKELAEAVAKIVLDARGEPFGSASKFPDLVNAAHNVLGRQPGQGLADDQLTRDIAASAKKIVLRVAELRGTRGTGHGRTRPPEVVAEHADITADAALLWTRWALRRLDAIVDGRVSDIVRDLWNQTFYKGDLAKRLAAANIPTLDEAEQHRLGLAVGQRSARATFNVLDDGVLAHDVVTWPAPYRVGVIEGAFFDSEGYLLSTAWATRGALRLLRSLEDDGQAVIERIVERAQQADIAYAFSTDERHAVVEVLVDNTHAFDEPILKALDQLAERIRPASGTALA